MVHNAYNLAKSYTKPWMYGQWYMVYWKKRARISVTIKYMQNGKSADTTIIPTYAAIFRKSFKWIKVRNYN